MNPATVSLIVGLIAEALKAGISFYDILNQVEPLVPPEKRKAIGDQVRAAGEAWRAA